MTMTMTMTTTIDPVTPLAPSLTVYSTRMLLSCSMFFSKPSLQVTT